MSVAIAVIPSVLQVTLKLANSFAMMFESVVNPALHAA